MSPCKLIMTIALLVLMHRIAIAEEAVMQPPAQAVEAAERAFADSMARRDFEAFKSFISEEAIFFSGATALRGRQQIADAWESFFKEPLAPFSWQPDQVEALDSGTLALSTGPVHDANGKLVGRFNSIWRLNAANQWRVVFDKGNDVCQSPQGSTAAQQNGGSTSANGGVAAVALLSQ